MFGSCPVGNLRYYSKGVRTCSEFYACVSGGSVPIVQDKLQKRRGLETKDYVRIARLVHFAHFAVGIYRYRYRYIWLFCLWLFWLFCLWLFWLWLINRRGASVCYRQKIFNSKLKWFLFKISI